MVSFTIPHLIPPTVNHYWKKTKWRNRFGTQGDGYCVSDEGIAFKHAVAMFARGATVAPKTDAERRKVRYGLFVRVVLGKAQSGDGDNFWKAIGDGVKEAGVIHSDDKVECWHLHKITTDRDNPRTEITVVVFAPAEKKKHVRTHPDRPRKERIPAPSRRRKAPVSGATRLLDREGVEAPERQPVSHPRDGARGGARRPPAPRGQRGRKAAEHARAVGVEGRAR